VHICVSVYMHVRERDCVWFCVCVCVFLCLCGCVYILEVLAEVFLKGLLCVSFLEVYCVFHVQGCVVCIMFKNVLCVSF